jgi:hypothetical protein
MKLFDIVPGNFFSVLVSGNREIYYDALMILHDMFKDELNIRVEDYIASLISILEDKAFVIEDEDDAGAGLQDGGVNTLSGKARLILNRLLKTGWIDKEFIDNSFIEIITPRRHAIPLLKVLSELGDEELQEYNSLVFSTYSSLKHAVLESESHVFEAVQAAKSNTEQLQYSLRALYHGIRGFLRAIVERQDVNLLLEDHFGEYKKMADHIYHPIKTLDSVHRYMSPIQSLLADIMANEDLMLSMRDRAIKIKQYDDESEADYELQKAIDYVINFYQTVDRLVSEIDRKHSNYTKSSIEKIQYLMTADQTMKGKLSEILKAYASLQDDKRERVAAVMEKHINAGRQEFLDAGSLYHKSAKNRRSNREPLAVTSGDEFSSYADELLLKQIKDVYPPARIRAFIDSLFAGGADEVCSKDMPIRTDADFILLILALLRRNDIGANFTVDRREGRVDNNVYKIPDMVFSRSTTDRERKYVE